MNLYTDTRCLIQTGPVEIFSMRFEKHLKKMLNRVAVVEGFIFAKKLLTVLTITLLIQKTKLQK